MIPIRDDQPRFSAPYITYFLIALNLLIYLFESALDRGSERALLYTFGVVPANITQFMHGAGASSPTFLPLFTSMFLHGSWLHVIGNMWFLWIFGDNVEDYLGHFKYLIFYLVSGVTAAIAQIVLIPQSQIPTVGASGAIAGVLGAYFILYPRARVLTWFPPIFLFYLPAWIMLGYWFVLQFLSGTATSLSYSAQNGGVAFWAHVGGFVAGIILIKVMPRRAQVARYGTY
ncbi:MAG: rhomboid family intramembrane serine protease [Terriglobales bacterium]